MLQPSFMLLFLLVLVLAIVPARRLQVAGWGSVAVGLYLLLLVSLALFVAEIHGPARLLVPLLGLLYAIPFFTIRDGAARLFGARGASAQRVRPPPRDVTPREVIPRDVTGREANPRDGTPPGVDQDSPDDRR